MKVIIMKVLLLVGVICVLIFGNKTLANSVWGGYSQEIYDFWNNHKEKENNDYEEDDDDNERFENNENGYYFDQVNIIQKNRNNRINQLAQKALLPFQGKTKDECQAEAYLYRSYCNLCSLPDFCSPSKNYYDETKTLYFYPVLNEGNYMSFIVLNQDNLSFCDNALLLYDFCQFQLKDDGTWSKNLDIVDSNSGEIVLCKSNEERKKYNEAAAKVANDLQLLYTAENDMTNNNILNPGWFSHGFKGFNDVSQAKQQYMMLSKNRQQYYTLNSEKEATEQKRQRFLQYGFTKSTILSEAVLAFLDETDFYLNITAKIYSEKGNDSQLARELIKPYKVRLKAKFDLALDTLLAMDNSYSGISRSDINAAKKILSEFKYLVQ